MKKLYRPLCFVAAVAAMSLTSCQKENFNPAGDGETVTITVHANVEDVANATKTHIDGTQVLWDDTEEMRLVTFSADGKNPTSFKSDSFTPDTGNATGKFTVTINTTNKNTTIAGVYPSSASVNNDNTDAFAYKINLPASQNASATSYDPAAYVMITRPESLPLENNEWTAYYKRATALNCMTLSGITDEIKSVTVTFPEGQQAAGRRYYNLATGEAGEIYHEPTNVVTVNYATPLKAGNGENDVWFTSWNVNVKTGEAITVRAESATKIYTKTLTATKDVALMENYLNIFPFDMTGATEETITPMPEFEAGEYWIMANTDTGWKAAKPISGRYGFLYVDDTTVGEDGTPVSTAANVFTIAAVDGGYTIQDASGKYYYMTENFNSFNVTTNASQEGNVWSIEQTGENEYSIVNVLKNKTMQYDSEYDSFGAYSDNRGILPNLVKAVYCDVTPSKLNVPAEAGTTTFNISSNEYWMIESNNPAYTVSPEEGTGNATITVTYPANESEEPVEVSFTVLSDSGIENTVTLTQRSATQTTVEITDVLTANLFKATGTTYTEFSGVSVSSSAVYAGKTAMSTDNDNAIQMRSSGSDCGIVTTSSNGKARKVVIDWHSETSNARVLWVYGSNEPFTSATELYNNGKGERIAEIAKIDGLNASFEIEGDYSYIGFRSNSGAMYINSIEITWEE
ncbi:MAG TPA: BACON domain-containing protein [Candidatus Cryptobacteroides merdipullorum]|uniref:BACON domain-containing protein n=1 Tax=Candidatus Cryptobacteroides merdipullorum TaxID=2840771 RepID=A0A9D1GLV2_9BACT|nr:BACON domain-containing protein [Candidatus Cryptobacteroides merdipullorum]